jgi:hypothetical protein
MPHDTTVRGTMSTIINLDDRVITGIIFPIQSVQPVKKNNWV